MAGKMPLHKKYMDTVREITRTVEGWQLFLRSASHNYKYRFDEQVLIFAANCFGKAVLSAGQWQRQFGRDLVPDAKGIEVFADGGDRQIVYFDISETVATKASRDIPIFSLPQEPDYFQAAARAVGVEVTDDDLQGAVKAAAFERVREMLADLLQDIHPFLSDAPAGKWGESELEARVLNITANSLALMVLHRCGIHPTWQQNDFRDICTFQEPGACAAIGSVASRCAGDMLRQIIRAVSELQKRYEIENRTFAREKESGYTVDRKTEGGGENAKQQDGYDNRPIRAGAGDISQGAQAGPALGTDRRRGVDGASPADRTGSQQSVERSDRTEQGSLGDHRSSQRKRSNEVGGSDEQPARSNARASDAGSHLQLNFFDEAAGDKPAAFLSPIPSVAQKRMLRRIHKSVSKQVEGQISLISLLENQSKQPQPAQEVAYRLGNQGFLAIQTTDNGYDYTIYHPDFTLVEGGQIDVLRASLNDVCEEILNAYQFEELVPEPVDYATLQQKVWDKEDETALPVHEAQIKENYKIQNDDLGVGTPSQRYKNNVAAIRTLKKLEQESRAATAAEQDVLASYVGWGGLASCFEEKHSKYQELKALLTPQEYEAARASTLTAFYTPPAVVKAIYQALENMGLHDGDILDPACGPGVFLGCVPSSMRECKLHGIEIDPIPGRIAKLLYPAAEIKIQGFEAENAPEGTYDAIVGNVPFGDLRVLDPKYDKLHFLIHDYFFAKSLDQVRPGGIVALITAKGTMDKESPAVRRYLAQRADLLGALRLPDNTFKRAAGTDVTSDIIFLQKRERPVEVEPDWVFLDTDAEGITMNRYFVEHPEMILGQMVLESTRYGFDAACKSIAGADLTAQLIAAISNIHGEITEAPQRASVMEGHKDTLPADPTFRSHSYVLLDGLIYFQEQTEMTRVSLPATTTGRVEGLVKLRDCVRELVDLQMEKCPDAPLHALQEHLNQLYDTFTSRYGLINDNANRLAFQNDSSYPLLCSLEVLTEDGKLKRKADMFSKRTIKSHRVVDHVDTASETLAVSIGERACVDLGYMAQLMGGSEYLEKIVEELRGVIYKEPSTGPFDFENSRWAEGWQTADEYLSGNVRKKLREAREGAAQYSEFEGNVAALEKVQPKDLSAAEIKVRLGAPWVPESDITQFIHELLDTPHPYRGEIRAVHSVITNQWTVEKKRLDERNLKANNTYGTKRISAYAIIEATLNSRMVQVWDNKLKDGKEVRELNSKQTEIALSKQERIKDEFSSWIWKDPDRRQRLCRLYNETFNSFRPRQYDGRYLVFSGLNPEITLRPHQINAIARIIYGGNTLLGHVVGAGKTYTMIVAAMEMKRLGLCSKSMVVVPNHITEQWAVDWLTLYPGANILVTREKDFERANRRKFCARIATGDFDAIIIGQSQFLKIPLSIERQKEFIKEQIHEILNAIREAKSRDGQNFTVKQMEHTRRSLEQRLEKLDNQDAKDDVVTFEELGIDRLFIDESHYYKNLFFATNMHNVAGIAQTEAQKSSDLFAKGRYLDQITGNRGLIFASGTPISNSMVELYTLQRYMQYDLLQQVGLAHFDGWANSFGETVTEMELAPEGVGFRLKTRFAKFFNIPELMSMVHLFADIQTADMLKLPVPKVERCTVALKPSKFQKELVAECAERADDVRNRRVRPQEDNMLKITNDGRKLALDQRLANPLLPDEPDSKVSACAADIYKIWQETAETRSAQAVFCDLSTPKQKSEIQMLQGDDGSSHMIPNQFTDVYNDLRDKLINMGIPDGEIAFIHQAKTSQQKKKLFAKVRSGEVRVILGSTSKMGAGTNMQERLAALHHLDCPWRPSDIEQREGRGVRQGNLTLVVRINTYIKEGTFDAYMWQLQEQKQRFIAQIMTSRSPVREAEDIDETVLSFAEIKALATGNPLIMERCTLDTEVRKLRLLKSSYESQRYELEDAIAMKYPAEIKKLEQTIHHLEQDILTASVTVPAGEKQCSPLQVLGITYTDKTEANKALLAACEKVDATNVVVLGTYRGFQLSLLRGAFSTLLLHLKGAQCYSVEMGGDYRNVSRLDTQLCALDQRLENCKQELDQVKQQRATAQVEVEKPFLQEIELQHKVEDLARVDAQLRKAHKELEKPKAPPMRS